jgi:glycosyltransferase involved in cell wall biosynthesis
VVHFHGYDIYRTDVLSQYEVEYKRLFREAAAMIVGSLAMKQHVTTLAGSDDRVFYNPCGVDIGAFLPIDASANPPVFIAVGRFVEKKAPHLTISAFRNVLDACPDAKLIMAGAGPLLDPCRQLVRAYGITDSVEFPGELAHREVAALLRTGRAFVQHSVTAPSGDSEGTAISILEAAATGLPVVSTLHAGIRDTMIHGRTGLLVAEYDIGTMAKHMIELANCPGRAAGLGAAAREHVAANYSMDASISGIAAVLSQAVSRFRERHAHAPDGSVDDRIAGVR